MMTRKSGPAPPPRKRSERWVYAAELAAGIPLALFFFLVLVSLLQWVFPGGTGIGELVSATRDRGVGEARLAFDRSGGVMIAVLTGTERSVLDKPASSVVWSTASPGSSLGERHAVQTLAGSSATIVFDESTVLELGENSVMVVQKPRRVLGSRKKRASLLFMDGSLRGSVGAGPDDMELELVTSGGSVRASAASDRGSTLELTVDRETSSLAVHEGTVELEWGGLTTVVPEGHMVTYDPTTPPTTPRRLPQPPRLVIPAPRERLGYRAAPPPVDFRWDSDDDTTDFRLEVARDETFDNPVFDDRLAERRFVHSNLPAGDYYWRVTGLNGPIAGSPSDPRRFAVTRDDVPPELEVLFPEGYVAGPRVEIRGKTEPGARVFVRQQSIPTDETGRFEAALEVREGYNFVVVQAIDPTGNTTFRNHTVIVRSSRTEEIQ